MVYCKLISNDGKASATYAFGGNTNDMTGRITFFSNGQRPVIENEPKAGKVSMLWISKLCVKYRDALNSGDFKEKMAYEC